MSKNDITLSPQFGVNPSITKCFWCGEDMGLALYGRLKGDAQAPKYSFGGYEPCSKCKEIFNKGIHVIGVVKDPLPQGFPPISKTENGESLYPDGSFFVSSVGFIQRLYEGDPDGAMKVCESGRLLMPAQLVSEIIAQNQKEDSEHESDEGEVSGSDTSDSD